MVKLTYFPRMTLAEAFNARSKTLNQFGLSPAATPQVLLYLESLLKANDELNLISRKMTVTELIDNHVLDCLLPLQYFPDGLSRVADFGSGGGLPAVLYAILFPKTQFRLFEKSPKKRMFLEACRDIAPNLTVDAEIPPSKPGQLRDIELVTARAFKPIDVIIKMSRAYFEADGKYFLLKGRREKIDEELGLTRRKADLKTQIIPLQSPVLEVERNLVLI